MSHSIQRVAHRRWIRVRTAAVSAAVVLLAACSDDPASPGTETCVLPQSPVVPQAVQGLSYSDLGIAVRDAADRNAAALPSSTEALELRAALAALALGLRSEKRDVACRAVTVADLSLNRQPESPFTLPDRTSIRLVIDIVSSALSVRK